MKLTVNGEAREVPGETGILQILELLKVSRDHVAVELNGEVVRRADHPQRALAEGDRLEVVTFVGGG